MERGPKTRAVALACAGLLASLAACTHFPYTAPGTHAELRSAIEAAHKARIDGPGEVRLAERMALQLQAGLVYIPPAEGERLLRAMGQRTRDKLLGVVVTGAFDTARLAALYAREERQPGIPELEAAGWTYAPALVGFRLW